MAKLPGVLDLGGLPGADPARPVAAYDASGIARGAAAMAAGVETLGKGIAKAGEGVGELAQDENRWDYAKANSDFQSRKVELDRATTEDQNYAADASGKTLTQRYDEQIEKLRTNSAGLIQHAPMRERFLIETEPVVTRGREAAQKHARSLSNNADIAYVSKQGDNVIDKGITGPDDETRRELIDGQNRLVDGLVAKGAVSAVQALEMKRNFAYQFVTADLLSRADSDPEGVINQLRAKPGSDADVTNRIVRVEGEGQNTRSSASGVGQFVDATWIDVLKRNRPDLAEGRSDADLLLLRADKTLARSMTDALRRENVEQLTRRGLEATPGNQYLAHFLGAGGAAAVLKADPNMPVIDVLAKAVGPDKARQMVDANPSILQGQLAGSVKQWADRKMGGQTPGSSAIYDNLRPDVREQVLARAETMLNKKHVDDLTDFKARIEDTQAEAARTGRATNPLQLTDFIGRLGAAAGPGAYQKYKASLDLGRDVSRVASLDPDEQDRLLQTYEPKPGAGFADQARRQDALQKAIDEDRKTRAKDPAFKARIENSIAEAARNGEPKDGIPRDEFEKRFGKDVGGRAYESYAKALKLGRDVRDIGDLSSDEQDRLLQSYEPVAGADDFVDASKRHESLAKAIQQVESEKRKDPAAFAITRLPAVGEAYAKFSEAVSDPTVPLDQRQAAARELAAKMDMEQARVGVPAADRRLVPKGYIERLNATLSRPAAAGGTANVVTLLEREAQLWGDNWPRVYRELAKEAQPVVRVVGSGVKPAAAQILVELEKLPLNEILKDQDVEKAATVKKDVLEAFKPLAATMAGNEGAVRTFSDFWSQGEKLAAFYVMQGSSASDAAAKAFEELIGHKYDFSGGTYRVPKDIAIAPDLIKAGAAAAKEQLSGLSVAPARDTFGGLSAEYIDAATARAYARDGVWVTAPDESGLALIYQDRAVPRRDGTPLVLSWEQLAGFGRVRSSGSAIETLREFPANRRAPSKSAAEFLSGFPATPR